MRTHRKFCDKFALVDVRVSSTDATAADCANTGAYTQSDHDQGLRLGRQVESVGVNRTFQQDVIIPAFRDRDLSDVEFEWLRRFAEISVRSGWISRCMKIRTLLYHKALIVPWGMMASRYAMCQICKE